MSDGTEAFLVYPSKMVNEKVDFFFDLGFGLCCKSPKKKTSL